MILIDTIVLVRRWIRDLQNVDVIKVYFIVLYYSYKAQKKASLRKIIKQDPLWCGVNTKLVDRSGVA